MKLLNKANVLPSILCVLLGPTLLCGKKQASELQPIDKGFTPLFDGKSLKGWEGKKKFFRVQDGTIIAGFIDARIPNNEFLASEKEYANFELRFDAKLVGQGNNAGVQFRSQRIRNSHEMIGYQCDIGGWSKGTIWGFLYDESRRRKMLAEAPQDELKKQVNPKGEWNKLIVRAEGPRIQIWLNGYQTVDFTEADKDIPLKGRLGLQIHSGPPAECHYRNLRIKKF
ncbi:MAG: hypothetical protein CMI26_00690 [Opitutae bacterium]|nr:hypothetical protein [Opitutae bacterium]|tara:strand:+ start:273 stop:950 length:678 start_codon:yes stop_codon:yes gene_type:complete